jgi:pentatricopeptide repeat protein
MLAAYVQCGEVDAALRFFGEMPRRDAVAWTTMIDGCANAGRAAEAVDLFWRMRKARVKDDAVTMVALLTACAELGHWSLDGGCMHVWIWKGGSGEHTLIYMYLKCVVVEDARCLFGIFVLLFL